MVPIWYHSGTMANLTIKKLPDPMYRQLKRNARVHGRSLNAEVIHIIGADLAEKARLEKMRASWDELERFVASLPPMEDSTPLIRQDRDRDD